MITASVLKMGVSSSKCTSEEHKESLKSLMLCVSQTHPSSDVQSPFLFTWYVLAGLMKCSSARLERSHLVCILTTIILSLLPTYGTVRPPATCYAPGLAPAPGPEQHIFSRQNFSSWQLAESFSRLPYYFKNDNEFLLSIKILPTQHQHARTYEYYYS